MKRIKEWWRDASADKATDEIVEEFMESSLSEINENGFEGPRLQTNAEKIEETVAKHVAKQEYYAKYACIIGSICCVVESLLAIFIFTFVATKSNDKEHHIESIFLYILGTITTIAAVFSGYVCYKAYTNKSENYVPEKTSLIGENSNISGLIDIIKFEL